MKTTRIAAMIIAVLLSFCAAAYAAALPDPKWQDKTNGAVLQYDAAALNPGVYASYIVLKPGSNFDLNEEELSVNAASHIFDYGIREVDGEFSYTVPSNAPDGRYRIRFLISDYPNESLIADYAIVKASELLKNTCVADFKTVTDSGFYEKFSQYSVGDFGITLNTVTITGINDYAEQLGKTFTAVRNAYMSEQGDLMLNDEVTPFDEISDVENCLKIASVIYNADKKSDIGETLYNSFKGYASRLFSDKVTYRDFEDVYAVVKNDDAVLSSRLATAIAIIKDGTYADIEYALSNYDDVLKINKSLASEKGVTILEAAKFIDNKNIAAYKNGMASQFAAAINKAVNAKKQQNPSNSNDSVGGGDKGYYKPSANDLIEPIQKESSFSDIDGVPWAKEAIIELEGKGVFQGDGNSRFEPNRNITRAEFSKTIFQINNQMVNLEKVPDFSDCTTTDWYYPYVVTLYNSNYINGQTENYFGASHAITRQDAFVIAGRMLGFSGKYSYALNEKFPEDFDAVSDYAKGFVYTMYNKGIIKGSENCINPFAFITRAEAAVLLKNISEYKVQ